MDTIHAIVSLRDWAARNSGGRANLPQVPWNKRQGDTALQGVLGFLKESKLGSVRLPCFSSAPSFSALRDEPVPDLRSVWTVHRPHDCGDLVPRHPQFTFRGIFQLHLFKVKLSISPPAGEDKAQMQFQLQQ